MGDFWGLSMTDFCLAFRPGPLQSPAICPIRGSLPHHLCLDPVASDVALEAGGQHR